jgi:hypothetical protein
MSPQKQALKAQIAGGATGPRTEEGKAVSSQNRLTHGLCAKKYAIHASQRPEFERHYNEMLAALAPVGAEEIQLAEAIILDQYRMARSRELENEIFVKGIAEAGDALCPSAETWAKNAKDLALLSLYAQRIHRVLIRNQADFAAKQAARKTAERDQAAATQPTPPAEQRRSKPDAIATDFVRSSPELAHTEAAAQPSNPSPLCYSAALTPASEAQIAA